MEEEFEGKMKIVCQREMDKRVVERILEQSLSLFEFSNY